MHGRIVIDCHLFCKTDARGIKQARARSFTDCPCRYRFFPGFGSIRRFNAASAEFFCRLPSTIPASSLNILQIARSPMRGK
jgi:hypothetical protein